MQSHTEEQNNPETVSSEKEKKELKIPESLRCPVTLQIFLHPVNLYPSNMVVEQQMADNIIHSNNPICPITREPIESYKSAFKVQEIVEEFLNVFPEAKKSQYVPEEPFTKLLEKHVSDDKSKKASLREDKLLPDAKRDSQSNHRFDSSVEHKHQHQRDFFHLRPQVPTPPPEKKPLNNADQEKLRDDLLDDIQNIIWALKFETGPQPQGSIQNFSLLFFAMIESTLLPPLPWQKIQVAEGPKNESMYEILKAAKRSLKELDPSFLVNCKEQCMHQYDQVQPLLTQARSLSDSKYARFAKKVGTVSNQPGYWVSSVIKKVESHLPALCAAEISLRNW